jgi:hypothetical protein
LNKEGFNAKPVEKHPTALVSLEFDDACNKVLGKNFSKQRLSQRKNKALREELVRRMQKRYGPYINIQSFAVKNEFIKFECNLTKCYTTDKGRIYASPDWSTCRDVYYTSHCFERFEQRADPTFVEMLKRDWTKHNGGCTPTPADLVMMMVEIGNHVHAPGDGIMFYLNIHFGALLIDVHEEFCLAKTFLTKEMIPEGLQWFLPEHPYREVRSGDKLYLSLLDIIGVGGDRVPRPSFDPNQEDGEYLD